MMLCVYWVASLSSPLVLLLGRHMHSRQRCLHRCARLRCGPPPPPPSETHDERSWVSSTSTADIHELVRRGLGGHE
jgi:hypothetical protein